MLGNGDIYLLVKDYRPHTHNVLALTAIDF